MLPLPVLARPDPRREDEFYGILAAYLNLERDTARKYTHAEYNLSRMPLLASLFDHPEGKLKVIHVAGTKGKGSVCHYATALLNQAGHRVGTFVSPHLLTVRERFLLDGEPSDYASLLEQTRQVERRIRQAGIKATFFEVLTILALDFFVARGCQFAVLETGIGGRLDCTNYIPRPECTAITAISYDHTALLGDTIGQIAREKAGIIKPGVPLVCGRQPDAEAEKILRDTAGQRGAPFYLARPLPAAADDAGLAPFQRENLAVAAEVCRLCGADPCWAGFKPPTIPGRCQCLRATPPAIIDAAHNADSARRLVEGLRLRYPDTEFTCVLGVVAGKDAAGILAELASFTRRFIFTHPRVPFKGSELAQLEKLAQEMGLIWRSTPDIRSPADLPAETPLLFTGSFFVATIGAEMAIAGKLPGSDPGR